jgi:hypothetical protein
MRKIHSVMVGRVSSKMSSSKTEYICLAFTSFSLLVIETGSLYVAQAGLKLTRLLPQPLVLELQVCTSPSLCF